MDRRQRRWAYPYLCYRVGSEAQARQALVHFGVCRLVHTPSLSPSRAPSLGAIYCFFGATGLEHSLVPRCQLIINNNRSPCLSAVDPVYYHIIAPRLRMFISLIQPRFFWALFCNADPVPHSRCVSLVTHNTGVFVREQVSTSFETEVFMAGSSSWLLFPEICGTITDPK